MIDRRNLATHRIAADIHDRKMFRHYNNFIAYEAAQLARASLQID
jgi:hypothetical protein